mmetsp:Transcript_13422/g.28848  ORF Transcript_13422/g.28848 Transcript_13422/m.28848 type:complete len:80 (+) Transcript_13422:2248-2487(+)
MCPRCIRWKSKLAMMFTIENSKRIENYINRKRFNGFHCSNRARPCSQGCPVICPRCNWSEMPAQHYVNTIENSKRIEKL